MPIDNYITQWGYSPEEHSYEALSKNLQIPRMPIVNYSNEVISQMLLDEMGMTIYPSLEYKDMVETEFDRQFEDVAINNSSDISTLSEDTIKMLVKFIRNPDKGSIFEEKMSMIPIEIYQDQDKLLDLLFQMGYGIKAKLNIYDETVSSFVAYQEDKNNNLLNIFKLHTNKNRRNNRLTSKIIEKLLEENPGVNVKVGQGRNETSKINKKSESTIRIFKENGYTVNEDNFIITNPY